MAKRHIVELIDDLDKKVIDDGGRTHVFSLDGRAYEIDLSSENGGKLRDALEPFIKAGRRSASGADTSPATPRTRNRNELIAIREWARQNGHDVSDRGRIADSVIEAYRAART